ncbi:hypothetical protein SISNIDRAFT_490748 [Sistotremastrum niveocremeum HHB9708]|uniref:Protein kinase domain-containing protein n=1 Tax=Sistotremastrum niveocremeum HHB9708 TaxID=1314777 RepID=A0A164NK06_9AGAM|nr:hypothetical protein SISNIDRAFT_490748 [Sistotremastrum niveocremeum HHB9708]
MNEPSLDSLPQSLASWRRYSSTEGSPLPWQLWDKLKPWLTEKGYHPWEVAGDMLNAFPPRAHSGIRSPDGFVYSLPHIPMNEVWFSAIKAIHWPARTSDHRDVVIRLIRKGDEGQEHLEVLRTLAKGERAFHAGNRCVPLLEELHLGDMTFAVFPFLADRVDSPWFYDFGEVFDFLIQALEGISYLHENLVAHLDIDIDNFLFNFASAKRCTGTITSIRTFRVLMRRIAEFRKRETFRSHFPVRYYLADMELCVRFAPESEPALRKVVGLPVTRVGIDPSKYGRDLVPEMAISEPYCPFRADMWQFGNMMHYMFQPSAGLLPELYALVDALKCPDPAGRPTAAQALERVRLLRAQTPAGVMSEQVPFALEIDDGNGRSSLCIPTITNEMLGLCL